MDNLPDFPEPVNPTPDLTRLAAFLCEQEYSSLARDQVLAYALATGTLEGCDWLEPEDRPEADALLEAAWPPVPSVSHRWDDDRWHGEPSRWTTAGPAVLPPERDVEPGESDPFEPGPDDWMDYR